MSQVNIKKDLALSAVVLMFFLSLSGCATISVKHLVKYHKYYVFDEFDPAKKELLGIYSGTHEISGNKFSRVAIQPSCKQMPIINLFLPIENISNSQAILCCVCFGLPDNKEFSGQVVKIQLSQSNHETIDINKVSEDLQNSLEWQGYPATIIFRHESKAIKSSIIYKTGPEANAFTTLYVISKCDNSSCGPYYCRNNDSIRNIPVYMLMPFAFVFDLITLPIQAIFFGIALNHL